MDFCFFILSSSSLNSFLFLFSNLFVLPHLISLSLSFYILSHSVFPITSNLIHSLSHYHLLHSFIQSFLLKIFFIFHFITPFLILLYFLPSFFTSVTLSLSLSLSQFFLFLFFIFCNPSHLFLPFFLFIQTTINIRYLPHPFLTQQLTFFFIILN